MASETRGYVQTFRNPTFAHPTTGDRMPNTGGWQDRHMAALTRAVGPEGPIVGMFLSWAAYADLHRSRYESGIGDDYVLGPEWEAIGRAIRALLNGECGRLDCGTLDSFIHNTLHAEGFDPDCGGKRKCPNAR